MQQPAERDFVQCRFPGRGWRARISHLKSRDRDGSGAAVGKYVEWVGSAGSGSRLLFGRSFLEKNNASLYPNRKKEYTRPIEVNWVNGAFLFFRNTSFQKIEGFDTNIFLYWEEMDLCHRLRESGFSSVLVPEAKVLHFQGVSIGTSEAIDKEAYISYLYVLRKNFGFLKYILIRKYLILVTLLKPKKWYLLSVLLKLNPSKASLKHQQKMRTLDEN